MASVRHKADPFINRTAILLFSPLVTLALFLTHSLTLSFFLSHSFFLASLDYSAPGSFFLVLSAYVRVLLKKAEDAENLVKLVYA